MRRLTASLLALSSLGYLACSSPSGGETTGTSNSAIIGGTADSGDPAVVELLLDVGKDEWSCTATFISQTVLLTAAHCVVDENNPKIIPKGAKFSLMTAASDSKSTDATTIKITTANVHPHPGYDGDAAHDVAIVVLDNPVDVTPIPINRNALTKDNVGQPVTLIGYGNNTLKNTGAGTKRTVKTTLRALQGDLAEIGNTGQQACEGDSGGPALMEMNGVLTLFATDDLAATKKDCQGGDLYQRTDLQLDFIDQYLTPAATGDDDDDTSADAGAPVTSDDGGAPVMSGDDDDDDSADAGVDPNDPNTPGTQAYCQLYPDDDSCQDAGAGGY